MSFKSIMRWRRRGRSNILRSRKRRSSRRRIKDGLAAFPVLLRTRTWTLPRRVISRTQFRWGIAMHLIRPTVRWADLVPWATQCNPIFKEFRSRCSRALIITNKNLSRLAWIMATCIIRGTAARRRGQGTTNSRIQWTAAHPPITIRMVPWPTTHKMECQIWTVPLMI